jgi:hypothetical protein
MIQSRLSRRLALLCGIFLLLLACTTIGELTGGGGTALPEGGGEDATRIDLWLDGTAALRSAKFHLDIVYADGAPKKWTAEIDSAGNTHLSIKVPMTAAFTADQPPDAPLPGDFELFIVGGAAYTRIGGEGPAARDDSYLTLFADLLDGPEGPGLWLNILPAEDYTPAGTESYGGFTAAKYTVDGQLEKGAVSGTIWVDDQSGALVGADLVVSDGLFFPPGSDRSGDVRITLTGRRMDVPAVVLP